MGVFCNLAFPDFLFSRVFDTASFCGLTWSSCTRRLLSCCSCCSAPSLWDSCCDSLLTSLSEDWKQMQRGAVNKDPMTISMYRTKLKHVFLSILMFSSLVRDHLQLVNIRLFQSAHLYAAFALSDSDSRLRSPQKQMSPFRASFSWAWKLASACGMLSPTPQTWTRNCDSLDRVAELFCE